MRKVHINFAKDKKKLREKFTNFALKETDVVFAKKFLKYFFRRLEEFRSALSDLYRLQYTIWIKRTNIQ